MKTRDQHNRDQGFITGHHEFTTRPAPLPGRTGKASRAGTRRRSPVPAIAGGSTPSIVIAAGDHRALNAKLAEVDEGYRWYRSTLKPHCRFLKLPGTEFMNSGLVRAGENLPLAADYDRLVTHYTTDANLAMSRLDLAGDWSLFFHNGLHIVRLGRPGGKCAPWASAPSFALAATITLLRWHGVGVTD